MWEGMLQCLKWLNFLFKPLPVPKVTPPDHTPLLGLGARVVSQSSNIYEFNSYSKIHKPITLPPLAKRAWIVTCRERNVSLLKNNNCLGLLEEVSSLLAAEKKNLSKAYFFSDKAFTPFYFTRGFFNDNGKISSLKRIGPHNIDIISIIVGSTLGDTHLERRKNSKGTRINFEQSNKNVEYLMWFHSYLSSRGYCNPQKPKLKKRIRKNGEVFFHYRINSYTFSSFNWLHDMFYTLVPASNINSIHPLVHDPNLVHTKESSNYVKVIPFNLEEFLTPLALAIWFSDDGSKSGKGAKIATNCFTHTELEFLCEILQKKYNITTSIHSGGKDKGEVIYIRTQSMPIFSKLVKPFILPSLYYKLGDY